MTVRANKPAFSIREKLKELQKPIGLKGSELMRAETAQEARDFVSAGRKNLVINGDMRIAQRGNFTTDGTNGLSLNSYTVDRWKFNNNGAGTDFFQHITSNQPDNLRGSKSIKMTVKSTASNYRRFTQIIEEYQRFKLGDFYTVSFWYKALNQSNNLRCGYWVDGNNFYQIDVLTTSSEWKYFSKTFQIKQTPTSSIDFNIGFATSNGGTASGVIGDYVELTGIQLEVGKNATEFEHRSYGEELALCQRYFYRVGGSDNMRLALSGNYSGNNIFATVYMPVEMRINPTISYSNLSHWEAEELDGGVRVASSITLNVSHPRIITLQFLSTTAFQFPGNIISNTSSAYFDFSAEL